MAVGFSEGTAGLRGLVLRWDGRRWSVQPAPEPAGARYAVLRDVACASRRSCVAVGDFELIPGFFRPYVLRWDGRAWAVDAVPEIPGATLSTLSGVSCPAARACIAVGEQIGAAGARTLALGWDGTAWSPLPTAEPPSTTFSLLADVDCARPASCVAVGQATAAGHPQPLAERWDGRAWRIEPTEDPGALRQVSLNGVSCPRRGGCVAVGFYEASLGGFLTLAEHERGGSWTRREAPSAAGSTLGAVSCAAPQRCVAVGGGAAPLAARWDGRTWTPEATPALAGATESGLTDVDCPTRHRCVAVGTALVPGAQRILLMTRNV
jgi:hypothetical protein